MKQIIFLVLQFTKVFILKDLWFTVETKWAPLIIQGQQGQLLAPHLNKPVKSNHVLLRVREPKSLGGNVLTKEGARLDSFEPLGKNLLVTLIFIKRRDVAFHNFTYFSKF